MFGVTPLMTGLTLAYAIVATVAAHVVVAWRRGEWRWRVGGLAAGVMWVLLFFAAGLVAARYIERLSNPMPGYLLGGALSLGLSLVEALLAHGGKGGGRLQWRRLPVASLVHQLVYLLAATVLYFLLTWSGDDTVRPLLLLPLFVGALMPDLDSPRSPAGRLLPFASRRLAGRYGECGTWHSLGGNALVMLIASPLALVSVQAWSVVPLGFFAHLLVDLFHPEGVMLFWPLSSTRYTVRGGPLGTAGGVAERAVALALATIAAALLIPLNVGSAPPAATPALTYEQNLDRYYSLRGRNLVFAYVQGAWQATGRRMSGRFEILNARGDSYLLLDRYTRQLFTAGRGEEDNLYLNYLSLQAGSAIEIKPVEVELQAQRIGDVLGVVYEMQKEPGLQYIYVSGEVILPDLPGAVTPTLPVDLGLTSLRRVERVDGCHYRLHYVEAAELIALADLQVENGALVIVATYAVPATGPTPTPLPSLPRGYLGVRPRTAEDYDVKGCACAPRGGGL
ncbi:MAG: metal-dependent hydrolase [Anaerolineae bacterium]|nr:metal-dependent hydrolase [Anaerolineae bacterium]